MKKNIIIPIIAALMSVAVAVGAALAVRHMQYGMWYTTYNGSVFNLLPVDMLSNYNGKGSEIVRNKKDLNELVGDIYDDTYNNAYFITNSLIVIEFDPSEYTAYWLKDVYRKGKAIVVEINSYDGVLTGGRYYDVRFLIEVKSWDVIGANNVELIINKVGRDEYEKIQ